MEYKEHMRKYAKEKYGSDDKYKNYMRIKSQIYRKAQSLLVIKYRKEFDQILKKLRRDMGEK